MCRFVPSKSKTISLILFYFLILVALRYSVCLVLLLAIGSFAQVEVNPCHGRTRGFARDLNSCENFWQCEGRPSQGTCPNGNQFDAETERCVSRNSNPSPCFRCQRHFQLASVPNACAQYVQCFNFQPTLHACPAGLVITGLVMTLSLLYTNLKYFTGIRWAFRTVQSTTTWWWLPSRE